MGDKDHDYIWLCTDGEYDNFELILKFQSFRKNIGNSGVVGDGLKEAKRDLRR